MLWGVSPLVEMLVSIGKFNVRLQRQSRVVAEICLVLAWKSFKGLVYVTSRGRIRLHVNVRALEMLLMIVMITCLTSLSTAVGPAVIMPWTTVALIYTISRGRRSVLENMYTALDTLQQLSVTI